jgi:N-acetyl-gamma-glutamyl-phosphate reductase
MSIRVAVAGASGYVGGELLRLIAAHPMLELGAVTANSSAGSKLGDFHPHIPQYRDHVIQETSKETLANHEVVFLALPHATSAGVANQLPEHMLVIDCGADFRLQDAGEWERYYGTPHAGTWPYGMPELTLAAGGKMRGRLREVRRIAVPGCNVTAVTLGLAPGLTAGLLESDDIVATLAVGTSGAGRSAKPELGASEILGSAKPYSVAGSHRHIPEILQNLSLAGGKPASISFTPVLVPMSRGILATMSVKPASRFSLEFLREVYSDAYAVETYIELLPQGEVPKTGSVVGSNNVQISLDFDDRAGRVLILCAIDNLVKGTAGAAIQSLNIALGLTEQTGLGEVGVAP